MRKKTNFKRRNGPNPRAIANREYKQEIYALCLRIQNGDITAEKILEKELKTKRLARWAVKHWIKLQKSRLKTKWGINKDGLPASRAKGRKKLKYGNAYKLYQGGIPGLGKKQ
jgi:hypothetical protein